MTTRKTPTAPGLREQREPELAALAAQPENQIDYSEVPPLDDAFWASAEPTPVAEIVRRELGAK